MVSDNKSTNNKDFSEDLRILESVLFASDEIINPQKLKSILPGNPDVRTIRKMVQSINDILQSQNHPFEIVEVGGGYQFRTAPYYHTWVRQLLKEKSTKKLSVQGLECLAIIAYKQPITKAEIESIRGVLSDGAMKTLLERRMITPVGRSEKPGRPLLYGTTKEFLEYFGVNKITDLPQIEEFENIAKEKMEELNDDELSVIKSIPDSQDKSEDSEVSAGSDESKEEDNIIDNKNNSTEPIQSENKIDADN